MEDRLRIAIFIDFDNIEIGVKNTLGRDFDVSAVLEALKERGEVLAKVAYADWTRQGTLSRTMSQHGVHMVQRHPSPRGDKNGADINLALDAMEMAFTKPHIDAFAIVSGDSDFISLVEKLKQYNKTVFIVGGRAFTSLILQKNCREFISYESLLGPAEGPSHGHGRGPHRSSSSRSAPASASGPALPLTNVAPLLRRALEVLGRREVQPQLGLLKSTMLQLDSAFTERDYGASSFRQFVEMLEKKHLVETKKVSGHYLVESPQQEEGEAPAEQQPLVKREDALPVLHKALSVINENDLWGKLDFQGVKEYVQRLEPDFDEKRYGFGQFAELLNYAQDQGLLRTEADEESVLRVFSGTQFAPARAVHAAHVVQKIAAMPGETLAAVSPAEETVKAVESAAAAALPADEPSEAEAAEPAAEQAAAEPATEKKRSPVRRRSRSTSGRPRQRRKPAPKPAPKPE